MITPDNLLNDFLERTKEERQKESAWAIFERHLTQTALGAKIGGTEVYYWYEPLPRRMGSYRDCVTMLFHHKQVSNPVPLKTAFTGVALAVDPQGNTYALPSSEWAVFYGFWAYSDCDKPLTKDKIKAAIPLPPQRIDRLMLYHDADFEKKNQASRVLTDGTGDRGMRTSGFVTKAFLLKPNSRDKFLDFLKSEVFGEDEVAMMLQK